MPFEEIEIDDSRLSASTGVKVGLQKMRGAPAKLRLSISKEVGDRMEWSDQERLAVLVGTGEHRGMIRLQRNKNGKAKATLRAAAHATEYFGVNLGIVDFAPDISMKGVWCQWQKVDLTTMEIVLP